MSQRNSGYARVPGEKYFTPPWVVECLVPHIPSTISEVFDPACGEGAIIKTRPKNFNGVAEHPWKYTTYLQMIDVETGEVSTRPTPSAEISPTASLPIRLLSCGGYARMQFRSLPSNRRTCRPNSAAPSRGLTSKFSAGAGAARPTPLPAPARTSLHRAATARQLRGTAVGQGREAVAHRRIER